MAHPTRADCDVTGTEELFVWDRDAREWRCNDCGALKQRTPTIKIDINGDRADLRRYPTTISLRSMKNKRR